MAAAAVELVEGESARVSALLEQAEAWLVAHEVPVTSQAWTALRSFWKLEDHLSSDR